MPDNPPSPKILTDLSNVKLCFFQANYTDFLQQIDAGIIRSFKVKYIKYLLSRVLAELESEKSTEKSIESVNIKKGNIFVIWSWDEVSSETIKNCWITTKMIYSAIVLDDTSNLYAYSEIQSVLRKIISNDEVKAEDYIEKVE